MGRPFLQFLDGTVYACAMCRTHLSAQSSIVSKQFHARSGRAYLFDSAVNVYSGPKQDRMMTTGLHVVCDLHCTSCCYEVGWSYVKAYEPSQKYKEGKVILERAKVVLAPASGDGGGLVARRASPIAVQQQQQQQHQQRSSGPGGSSGGGSSPSDPQLPLLDYYSSDEDAEEDEINDDDNDDDDDDMGEEEQDDIDE